MSFIYYHKDCPTCKNKGLILVEQAEAKLEDVKIDKRYIWVLPDVWGEEAERIGGTIPFLYDVEKKQTLHVDASDEEMAEKIADFLGTTEPSKLV